MRQKYEGSNLKVKLFGVVGERKKKVGKRKEDKEACARHGKYNCLKIIR